MKKVLAPLGKPRSIWFFTQLEEVSKLYNFDYDTPLNKFSEEQIDVVINGTKEKIAFYYTYGSGRPVKYMHRFQV